MIKQILIVDDDPDVLFLLTCFLTELGPDFQLTSCSSGLEALTLSQAKSFDLTISDYDMPGLNGLQLASAMKERQPDLKFILVTGRGGGGLAEEAPDFPLIGFIAKPFTPDLVWKVVRAVLAN